MEQKLLGWDHIRGISLGLLLFQSTLGLLSNMTSCWSICYIWRVVSVVASRPWSHGFIPTYIF